jgi:MFS family permease
LTSCLICAKLLKYMPSHQHLPPSQVALPAHESPTPTPPPTRFQRTFAALKHPNYRLWFQGQLVSLFGSWMQTTAQGFLVFELTHSPQWLGYVGFAAGVPTWILTLYGGVVADRISRRSLLVITQTIMMVLAFILAGLAFFHLVQPWHVVLLALGLGITNSFDAPARQAFVSEMVPREDLTNAIALNATMFHSATAIGPAAAGLVYALFGAAACFAINGLSFIAVIIALRKMKLTSDQKTHRSSSAMTDLKEGLRFVVTEPTVRVLISMVAVTSFFAMSLTTLIPAWAVKVLGGNAATNGFLLSARGVGSLGAALFIASLGRISYRGRLVTIGSVAFPTLLLAFAFTRSLSLSLLCLAGAGGGMIFVNNVANAMVQTRAPDHLRGRVMGAYTWIFFGSMPLGALWLGTAADRFGEPEAVLLNSLLALAYGLGVLFLYPKLRKE